MIIDELEFRTVQCSWQSGLDKTASQGDIVYWLTEILDILSADPDQLK